MTKLAILGASGHGKVIAEAAILSGKWTEIIFFDDAFPEIQSIEEWTVLGNTRDLIKNKNNFGGIIIGIGDNKIRMDKYNYLKRHDCNIVSIIHPSAIISQSVSMGFGTVVMAGAIINAYSQIGYSCIINSNAVVEHDCLLSDGVHISPGVLLAGDVSIGISTWIGIGSTVKQQITIVNDVIVGAGSVVVKDIVEQGIFFGNPLKKLKKHKKEFCKLC